MVGYVRDNHMGIAIRDNLSLRPSLVTINFNSADKSSQKEAEDPPPDFILAEMCGEQESVFAVENQIELHSFLVRRLYLRQPLEEIAQKAFENYCAKPDLVNFSLAGQAARIAISAYTSLAPIEQQEISSRLLPRFDIKTLMEGGPLPYVIFFTTKEFIGYGTTSAEYLQSFEDFICPNWKEYFRNNPDWLPKIVRQRVEEDRRIQIEVLFSLKSIANFLCYPTQTNLKRVQRNLRVLETETAYKKSMYEISFPLVGRIGSSIKKVTTACMGKWHFEQMETLLQRFRFFLTNPLFCGEGVAEAGRLTPDRRATLELTGWRIQQTL